MPRWRRLAGPRLRQVIKVVLAALLAYVLTLGKRNDFALFSALGAAMVVGGSLGEDLKASLNRVRGTLAGTLVGIVLAYALGTSIWSLALAVAAITSLSVGLDWGAPAMRIGLAMALVVLFSHGSDPAHYALWRAFDTLIGVAVGLGVSRYVWPVRARDEITDAIDQTLAATAAALDALASGACPDSLLSRQLQVHDALAALRTGRKNARLEQRVAGTAEILTSHTLPAARAAIATLAASVNAEDLLATGAGVAWVQSVREAIQPLAARAQDLMASDAGNFAARIELARRAAAATDLEPRARGLLAGLLNELEQIDAALEALREARRRDIAP